MKKLMITGLVLALAVSMAACGGTGAESSAPSEDTSVSEPAETPMEETPVVEEPVESTDESSEETADPAESTDEGASLEETGTEESSSEEA